MVKTRQAPRVTNATRSPDEPASPESKIARRDFLAGAGWATLLVAAGSALAAVARFLDPRVTAQPAGPIEVGMPQEYAVGSLTFVDRARAFLGRDEGGYYAILATCTHLGCTPRLEGGEFVCPCHGSRFNADGTVISGPAKRPLERAFVDRAKNGRLVVDVSRRTERAYRLKA